MFMSGSDDGRIRLWKSQSLKEENKKTAAAFVEEISSVSIPIVGRIERD